MSETAKGEMTITELAKRTGMTVRNIRAHQTRGLLPPPVVRGRTGYYNEDHVARIALTREMQADGLNLEAIRRVLKAADGAATEIFDFTRAVRAPFEDEPPEIIDLPELAGLWSESIEGKRQLELLRRGEKLGAVRALPGGQIEVISPRMLRAAMALGELGVSPDGALAAAEKLRREADGAARTFVELFMNEVWQPFNEAGFPEGDWPKVREALERLRPLASDALLGAFQIAMGDAVEKATERTLRATARRKPSPASGKPRKPAKADDDKPRRRKRSRRS